MGIMSKATGAVPLAHPTGQGNMHNLGYRVDWGKRTTVQPRASHLLDTIRDRQGRHVSSERDSHGHWYSYVLLAGPGVWDDIQSITDIMQKNVQAVYAEKLYYSRIYLLVSPTRS